MRTTKWRNAEKWSEKRRAQKKLSLWNVNVRKTQGFVSLRHYFVVTALAHSAQTFFAILPQNIYVIYKYIFLNEEAISCLFILQILSHLSFSLVDYHSSLIKQK